MLKKIVDYQKVFLEDFPVPKFCIKNQLASLYSLFYRTSYRLFATVLAHHLLAIIILVSKLQL